MAVPGVDEFALRRDHQYGTVPIDLTDDTDRSTYSLAAKPPTSPTGSAHPGTEVICRDRAGGYADGARDGAPDTVQVADRWHLWDQPVPARGTPRLEAAHHTCLPEPVTPAADHADNEPADLTVLQWPDTVRVANTRRRYQQIDGLPKTVLAQIP